MAHWRTIDATAATTIGASRGRWLVDEREAPLANVTAAIIGKQSQVTTHALLEAARFDVPILVCDWRNVPVSQILPWTSNGRVCARHHAQADLTVPRAKSAWKQIVKSKIHAQANVLEPRYPDMSKRIRQLTSQVKSGDTGGAEALAARLYWSVLLEGERRLTQQKRGRNAMLDYGYTILRGMTTRAICETGLWPTMSIWHHTRSNSFALADDLMEPLRPAIDAVVLELWDKNFVSLAKPETKRLLVESIVLPGAGGKKVPTLAVEIAQNFAQYVEGGSTTLEVPIWNEKN